jgi:hypothetical protein
MSMDPDGTNRIIQQQIKEWHAILDGERTAKLLEPERVGLRRSLAHSARHALTDIVNKASLIRHRIHAEPAAPGLHDRELNKRA